MFQLNPPIPFKLNLDHTATAAGDVLDVSGFFGIPGKMPAVAETFRRGKIVLTVDHAGAPVFISISEADEIDATFKAACNDLAQKREASAAAREHIVRYLVEQARSMLETVERKRAETLDKLRFENLQMVS